jgi:hypothetical protein
MVVTVNWDSRLFLRQVLSQTAELHYEFYIHFRS